MYNYRYGIIFFAQTGVPISWFPRHLNILQKVIFLNTLYIRLSTWLEILNSWQIMTNEELCRYRSNPDLGIGLFWQQQSGKTFSPTFVVCGIEVCDSLGTLRCCSDALYHSSLRIQRVLMNWYWYKGSIDQALILKYPFLWIMGIRQGVSENYE